MIRFLQISLWSKKSGFELEINKFDIYRDNYGYRLI